jgi:hypothetical protein
VFAFLRKAKKQCDNERRSFEKFVAWVKGLGYIGTKGCGFKPHQGCAFGTAAVAQMDRALVMT